MNISKFIFCSLYLLFSIQLAFADGDPLPGQENCVQVDDVVLADGSTIEYGCVSSEQANINRLVIKEAIRLARESFSCLAFTENEEIFLGVDPNFNTFHDLHPVTVSDGRNLNQQVVPLIDLSNADLTFHFNNVNLKINSNDYFNWYRKTYLQELGKITDDNGNKVFCFDDFQPSCTGPDFDCNAQNPQVCEACPICIAPCQDIDCQEMYGYLEPLANMKFAVILVNTTCSPRGKPLDNITTFQQVPIDGATLSNFSITGVDINNIDNNVDWLQFEDNDWQDDTYNGYDTSDPNQGPAVNPFNNPFIFTNNPNGCTEYENASYSYQGNQYSACEYQKGINNGTIDEPNQMTVNNPDRFTCDISRPWGSALFGIYLNFEGPNSSCYFPAPPSIDCNTSPEEARMFSQISDVTISNLQGGITVRNAKNMVLSHLYLNNFTDAAFECIASDNVNLLYSDLNGGGDGNCTLAFGTSNSHVYNCNLNGLGRTNQLGVIESAEYCSIECSYVTDSQSAGLIINRAKRNSFIDNTISRTHTGVLIRTTDNPNPAYQEPSGNDIIGNHISLSYVQGSNNFSGVTLLNSKNTRIEGNTIFAKNGNCIQFNQDLDELESYHENTYIDNNTFYLESGSSSFITQKFKSNASGCPPLKSLTLVNNKFTRTNSELPPSCDINYYGLGNEVTLHSKCENCTLGNQGFYRQGGNYTNLGINISGTMAENTGTFFGSGPIINECLDYECGPFSPANNEEGYSLKLREENNKTLDATQMSVFPIPANEEVFIQFEYEVTGKVNLYNLSGQKTMSLKINEEQIKSIDTSLLTPGIYFIVFSNEEIQYRKKLIVK